MGEAAEVAGDGGATAGDGGAGDARAVCRRRRAPRPAAQHTAARRRVRTGRASTATSPLSASRADEKQLPASTQQVCERRARVGGRCGGGRSAARRRRRWRWRRRRRRRQEGRAAAEGHALVGAHGRPSRRAVPAGRGPASLRHGAAPRRARPAARRVTEPHKPRLYHITLTFHNRDGRTRRSARASRSIIDLVFIYSGAAPGPVGAGRAAPCRAVPCRAVPYRAVPCRTVLCRLHLRAVPVRTPVFLAPSKSFAKTKTEIK